MLCAVVCPSIESVQSDSAALPATDLRHTQCSANKRKEVLPREEDRKIRQLPSQHSSELVPIIGRTHLLRKNSSPLKPVKEKLKLQSLSETRSHKKLLLLKLSEFSALKETI